MPESHPEATEPADFVPEEAATPARPRYTGLRMAAGVGFSLAHPIEWNETPGPADTPGIVLSPQLDDPYTVFSVAVTDIPEPLDPEDADILHQELMVALGGLPGIAVHDSGPLQAGLLRGAEARYDIDDGDARRRRWVRILIERTRQLTVTAQGSSPERFDYWEPQLFTTMASVRIHHGATRPDHDELRT